MKYKQLDPQAPNKDVMLIRVVTVGGSEHIEGLSPRSHGCFCIVELISLLNREANKIDF